MACTAPMPSPRSVRSAELSFEKRRLNVSVAIAMAVVSKRRHVW
jgi:hypothetical protein